MADVADFSDTAALVANFNLVLRSIRRWPTSPVA